jgi:hypothetical protein
MKLIAGTQMLGRRHVASRVASYAEAARPSDERLRAATIEIAPGKDDRPAPISSVREPAGSASDPRDRSAAPGTAGRSRLHVRLPRPTHADRAPEHPSSKRRWIAFAPASNVESERTLRALERRLRAQRRQAVRRPWLAPNAPWHTSLHRSGAVHMTADHQCSTRRRARLPHVTTWADTEWAAQRRGA